MERNKKILGKKGEAIAEQYLEKLGYRIIERNYKVKYAEIDIIAKDHNTLVFVEVRAKSNDKFGLPEETINKEKIWRLKRSLNGYLKTRNYNGSCRIDVMSILFDNIENQNNSPKVTHYKNITS